jgi:hypothetical protein
VAGVTTGPYWVWQLPLSSFAGSELLISPESVFGASPGATDAPTWSRPDGGFPWPDRRISVYPSGPVPDPIGKAGFRA